MARYTCGICGEGMNSKCKNQRSIFPDNQVASLLTNFMSAKSEPANDRREPELKVYTFTFKNIAENERQALKNAVSWINEPGVLDYVTCDHKWILQSEKCELGCCSKKVTT